MIYTTHLFRHTRKAIGENILLQRKQKNLTPHKLAQLSGVSCFMLDQYESGKFNIGLQELLRIACALDIVVSELLAA